MKGDQWTTTMIKKLVGPRISVFESQQRYMYQHGVVSPIQAREWMPFIHCSIIPFLCNFRCNRDLSGSTLSCDAVPGCLDRQVQASVLLRAISGADKKLITDVKIFDLFEGPSLGEDRKSVAVEVVLQPKSKTLTDEEIEAVSSKIISNVEKSTGGQLRA